MSAVPLDAVKSHLNLTAGTHDGELQTMIDAAEEIIARRVGPLEPTTVTTTVASRGGLTLLLPTRPILSLTSVTASDAPVDDTSPDLEAGVVTLPNSAYFPTGDVVVTYQAGRTTLPADLRLAVLELVRHFWDTQRGPTRRPGSTASDAASNTIPGAAYMFPFRVEQLLAPHEQYGFA